MCVFGVCVWVCVCVCLWVGVCVFGVCVCVCVCGLSQFAKCTVRESELTCLQNSTYIQLVLVFSFPFRKGNEARFQIM